MDELVFQARFVESIRYAEAIRFASAMRSAQYDRQVSRAIMKYPYARNLATRIHLFSREPIGRILTNFGWPPNEFLG